MTSIGNIAKRRSSNSRKSALLHGPLCSEEELLETANLIALVFRLDSVDSVEEILEAFFKFSSVITKLTLDEFTLFKAWAQKVLPKSFPEERKKEIIDALEETRPGRWKN